MAIRTDPGTKLSAAAQGQVAFEIDGIDEAARAGWSVVVTGVGYEVTDALDDVQRSATPFPGRHLGAWSEGSLDPDRAADRNGPETSTRLRGSARPADQGRAPSPVNMVR